MSEVPQRKPAHESKDIAAGKGKLASPSLTSAPAFTTSDEPSDLPLNKLSLSHAASTNSNLNTIIDANTNINMPTKIDASIQTTMNSQSETINLDEHCRWLDHFLQNRMPTSVFPSVASLPVSAASQVLKNKAGQFTRSLQSGGSLVDLNKAELSSANVNNVTGKGDRYAKLLHMKTRMEKEKSEVEMAFAEWKEDNEKFSGLRDERDRLLMQFTELKQSRSLSYASS
jgi:hypothetical protein